jgi:NDP-sugar pyrophosphorylase family protein
MGRSIADDCPRLTYFIDTLPAELHSASGMTAWEFVAAQPWRDPATARAWIEVDGSWIHPEAFVHRTAIVTDSVICAGARVFEYTTVRGAYVGDGALVGHCSEVARSYIGARTAVTHFCYVGDSVLGNEVLLGGGVRTANRRLDAAEVRVHLPGQSSMPTGLISFGAAIGDRCRLGGGVHLNPGTCVGPDSIIGPGLEIRGFVTAGANLPWHFTDATESADISDG